MSGLLAPAVMILVAAGAAVQVAVGAGLSVVCGPLFLAWLGPQAGLPLLLFLNFLVSAVATAFGGRHMQWRDVLLASLATLAGCAIAASAFPTLPVSVLKGLTAAILIVVALPRPPQSGVRQSGAMTGIAIASLITGALTVWTATPGPITPVALARAGRSGAEIRRTMQPISVTGYGVALAWVGIPTVATLTTATAAGLIAATLLGIALGFAARPRIDPVRVVLVIRIVAAVAALLLIVSLLR